MKGSLKKIESSFICRRCKGELSETRQVNSQVISLHIDGHEYEIVDKFCYLGDMLSQQGSCEHAILKRIQTGWLKFRELFTSAYRKRDECQKGSQKELSIQHAKDLQCCMAVRHGQQR